jgi:ATP-dependent protease ClpP protease subunit
MKFQYAHNIDSDEPIMLINKHIGFDSEDGMGIDGSLFQQELLALDQMNKKRIQIWINSVGGVVMDGYNICNAILKSNTRVDTYCLGMAASIAGVIFQTGRKRVIADYGILMYHNPYTSTNDTSPLLDQMKDSLNTIISKKSGMDSDAVHRMMDRTSFIGSSEAKAMGLCDEIEETVSLNTKNFPKAVNDSKAYWNEANKVLNKSFINTNNMVKVNNKLGLSDDASQESVLKAIETMENKYSALEVVNKASKDEMDKMKNDMDDAENKFKEMKDAYDKVCNEMEELNKEKVVAENAVKEEKAKNMVEGFVKDGVIKNDAGVIAEWVADATVDFDKIQNRLSSIPVNKVAAKFVMKEGDEKPQYPTVALKMAQISNKMENK